MEKKRAKTSKSTESGGIFLAEFEAAIADFMNLIPMTDSQRFTLLCLVIEVSLFTKAEKPPETRR